MTLKITGFETLTFENIKKMLENKPLGFKLICYGCHINPWEAKLVIDVFKLRYEVQCEINVSRKYQHH